MSRNLALERNVKNTRFAYVLTCPLQFGMKLFLPRLNYFCTFFGRDIICRPDVCTINAVYNYMTEINIWAATDIGGSDLIWSKQKYRPAQSNGTVQSYSTGP